MSNLDNKNFTEIIDNQKKIDLIYSILREANYNAEIITLEELEKYFEGEAPSGDTITLEMIFKSKWLLIHEIVECSELKKLGYKIEFNLLHTKPQEVFLAHLEATDWELKLASKAGDMKWVKKRLFDVKSWLDDPNMVSKLKNRIGEILSKYN